MKFKVGDRVRRINEGTTKPKGYTFIVKGVQSSDVIDDEGITHFEKNLELATPSWDNLQVGDIILDTDNTVSKVLAVIGDVFLKSNWGEFDKASAWLTVKEAQAKGWTLKDSTPTSTAEQDAIKLLKDNGYKIIKE